MNAAFYALFAFYIITGCNNPFSEKSLVEGGFAPPKLSEESPAVIPSSTPTPTPTPTMSPTPIPTPVYVQPSLGTFNDLTFFGMSTSANVVINFTTAGLINFSCSSSFFSGSTSTSVTVSFSGTMPDCRVSIPVVGGYTGVISVTVQTIASNYNLSKSFTITVLPSVEVGYSLRHVVRGYTGSAIRVCLTSTCTSQTDIGFDANGDLDQSALSTFCGASACYVRTWYDQSGNARDAVQTTNAYQPLIFTSGATTLSNGKPTIRFDGSNDFLTQLGYSYSFAAFNSVWRHNNTVTQAYSGLTGQRVGGSAKIANSTTNFILATGSFGATNQTNISEHAGSASAAWINSSPVSSLPNFNNYIVGVAYGTNLGILSLNVSATAGGVKNLTIGSDSMGAVGEKHGAMDISELFFLSSLSTSDRNLLESDQRSYYATP